MIAQALLAGLLALPGSAAGGPPPGPSGEVKFREGGKRLNLTPKANEADAEGIRLLAEGSYDEAVQAFDRSLKIAKRNPRALANRGAALAQLGRLDDALRDYDAAIAIEPALRGTLKGNVVETRLRRGRGHLTGSRIPLALEDFYAAARADRRDPRPYAAIASAGRQTRQYETCVSYAGRATQLGAENADVYVDRAACLAALGRREQALKDLDRAILLDNRRADAYASRAVIQQELGNPRAAQRDAAHAIQLEASLADRLAPLIRK